MELSSSLDRIGEANLILGNLNAAGAAYDESLIIRRRLVDLDLLNGLWQDGIALVQKKIVELRHAAEAQALAEDRVSRPELLLGPDKTSLEPKEQLLLTVGNIRNVGEVIVRKVLAAYEERFAVVLNSIPQSAMLRVGEVYRKLSLRFPELNTNRHVGEQVGPRADEGLNEAGSRASRSNAFPSATRSSVTQRQV